MSVQVTVRGITIPVYFDVFGFVVDANAVSLFATGVPLPLTPIDEAHLFSLLLARAKAPSGPRRERHARKRPKITTA